MQILTRCYLYSVYHELNIYDVSALLFRWHRIHIHLWAYTAILRYFLSRCEPDYASGEGALRSRSQTDFSTALSNHIT